MNNKIMCHKKLAKNKFNGRKLYIDGDTSLQQLIKGKTILYIATTYLDYLRVQQEISLLNKHAKQVFIIVSKQKHYIIRLLYVYLRTIFFFKKIDLVFMGFAPQLLLPLLKWRFSNKLIIIDFFISIYDTLVFDRMKFPVKSMRAKLAKYLDIITLKYTDYCISDTQAHAEYFVKELGAIKSKIIVLYLQADSKYYYPKSIVKPTDLINKFVVLYFGTALPLQGIDVILKAITEINNDEIHFIMIGPLDKNIKYLNLHKNVKFIDWLEQNELSDYISWSDLCLAGHFNGEITKARRVIPGKAYIYEAMNKPMILGENNANRERYPVKYSNVSFVKMGCSKSLVDKIDEYFQGWLSG